MLDCDVMARVMRDGAAARIVAAASRDHVSFFRDIARGLRDEGKHRESVDVCDMILRECPDDAATLLISVRGLAAMGEMDEALRRLSVIKQTHLNGESIAEMQRQLAAAADVYDQCLSLGQAARAARIAESMLALCPGVAMFEEARARAERQAASDTTDIESIDLTALHQQALRHQEAFDFEAEIDCREAITRHKLAATEHSAVRISNMANLIARLLGGDIDTPDHPHIARARHVLAAIAALPSHPDRSGDTPVWERFQRRLLGTIDLDAVFGPPADPGPFLPLSFASAEGEALSLDDVAARAASMGTDIVFFTSASAEYFERYVDTHVTSILSHCDRPCLVLVCVCVPVDRLASLVAGHGFDDPRVIFCADGFDPDAASFDIVNATDRESIAVPAAYYASAALLRMDALLRRLRLPVFVCGIDTVLQGGVGSLLDRTQAADVVLNAVGAFGLLGSHYINSLVLTYPTSNGLLFAEFLKAYLGRHLAEPIQAAAIDQLDLHMARHHVMANGTNPVIASFAEHDINNAMFNRINRSQHVGFMRRFTFLNMFVGGSGNEALRVEDLAPAPLARAA